MTVTPAAEVEAVLACLTGPDGGDSHHLRARLLTVLALLPCWPGEARPAAVQHIDAAVLLLGRAGRCQEARLARAAAARELVQAVQVL